MKIVFSGKLGAGKDSAAEYLMSKHSGVMLKFAGPLYELQGMIQDFCGFSREKDGALLQYLGTGYGRIKDPDIWVKLAMKAAKSHESENVFFTDGRFPNEIQAGTEAGFVTVRINRSMDGRSVNLGNRDANHPSETALDGMDDLFHEVIENDGSLEEFHAKLDAIVEKYYGGPQSVS